MAPFGYGYGHMTSFGWIGMLLFWILIALGIVWLWRSLDLSRTWRGGNTGEDSPSRNADRSLEILRERYAKGEIDAEQFEKMKRDLT